MADAVFTEVLELSIDAKAFRDGLRAVESEYNAFVARMSSKNNAIGNVVNIGGIGSIGSELTQLRSQLGQFAQAVTQAMGVSEKGAAEAVRGVSRAQSAGQGAVNAAAASARGQIGLTKKAADAAGSSITGHLSATDRFFRKLQMNLPELGATILRYTVGFMILRGVMQSIGAFFSEIIGAFKEGLAFNTMVQERATDIKEALLQNVKLSADWAINVKKAGEAADFSSHKILDFAARAALIPEKIEAGLKSLIQAGGLRLMNGDLNASIELTGKLLSLMRARGISDTNQRRFVTEVNDLMTGQVKKVSVLLQVLGFTTSEWKKIRAEALKTGDLLNATVDGIATVASRLKAVEQRIETAGDRWKDLVNTVNIYKLTVFGAIAEPLWRRFLEILRSIKKEFETHRDTLLAVATMIGESVTRAFGLATAFTKSETPLQNILSFLAKAVLLTERFADTLITGFSVIAQKSAALAANAAVSRAKDAGGVSEFDNPELFRRQQELNVQGNGDLARRVGEENIRQLEKKAELEATTLTMLRGEYTLRRDASDQALQDIARIKEGLKPLGEIKVPAFKGVLDILEFLKGDKSQQDVATPRDELQALSAQFQEELASIKSGYQETQNALKEMAAEGDISFKVLAENSIGYFGQESDAIDALVKKYQSAAGKVEGASEIAVAKMRARFGLVGEKDRSGNENAASGVTVAATKEEQSIAFAHFKALEQQAREHARTMLSIYKEEASAGLHTAVEVFDAEVRIAKEEHDSRVSIFQKELVFAKENLKEQARITDELAREDQAYTDVISKNASVRMALAAEEARRSRDAALELNRVEIERLRLLLEYASRHGVASSKIRADSLALARAELALTFTSLTNAKAELVAAQALGLKGKAIEDLIKKVKELEVATQSATNKVDETKNKDNPKTKLIQEVFGENVTSLKEAFGSFQQTVQSLAAALTFFRDTARSLINAWQQGKESGGVLGGIGGVMGAAAAIDPEPISKAILQIGSVVFGFIGGIFKRAAKKMADQIKASIKESMDAYKAGSVNLIDTINKLEQQRASAISRLSSKKGGKDELKKLLPDLDAQIADLKKAAADINTAFNEALDVLRLQSDPLGNLLKSWRELNKQVKEYIGAGGDAAKAAEFLSLSLQKIREDNIASLESGERAAVDDMLQLNDLLKQRIELVNQFKKDEFDLINAGAIERQAAPAVRAGLELATKRAEFQEKLTQLDSEISLTTIRVDKEREVFTIASDTAALRARANELELLSLDRQIASWKDIQAIIAGITQSSAGLFGLTPGLGMSIGVLNVNNPASGAAVVGEMEDEFNRRGRYGYNKYAEENA